MPVVRQTLTNWENFHATVKRTAVSETRPTRKAGDPMTDYGSVLNAAVKTAFANGTPLRPVGATWSLSNIIDPGSGPTTAELINTSDLNQLAPVAAARTSGSYSAHVNAGKGVPMLVDAGTHIGPLNDALGAKGLSIRTSGAADGHRIAGLIATATHGSALRIGCLHDTIKAIHVMTGPDEALLIQPALRDLASVGSDPPFADELAKDVGERIGIPTRMVTHDAMFEAAIVGLGSCGIVLSVILDTAPLYVFDGEIRAFASDDPKIPTAIKGLDPTKLGLDPDPYHFALVALPYAKAGDPGFFVTALHDSPAGAQTYVPSAEKKSMVASDMSEILSDLIPLISTGPTSGITHAIINGLAAKNYGPRPIHKLFAGQVFGGTRLPPGNGRSAEIAVAHADAWRAVDIVLTALRAEAQQGRLLLGAIGIRFAPRSRALLAMSHHNMNCFIELPTIGAAYMSTLFANVWKALDAAHMTYAFHWGQENAIDPARVDAYYGQRATAWTKARNAILPNPAARAIFASPMLATAGLG